MSDDYVSGSEWGRKQALRDFADMLDRRRPSDTQLKVGNIDYNTGASNALRWAAEEARKLAG